MSFEDLSVPEENAKVTHDELIRYMSLDESLDESIIDAINRHREISGDPIAKWCDTMERKATDPFNVDWNEINGIDDSGETGLS